MSRAVSAITVIGMIILIIGLISVVVFQNFGFDLGAVLGFSAYGSQPPAYFFANCCWLFSGFFLIIPPLVHGVETLAVLLTFTTLNTSLSFWEPKFEALKVLVVLSVALTSIGYLCLRGHLPALSFPKSLVVPSFYIRAWREGETPGLAVGIAMLGIGYAFTSMLMLTIGSTYLVRSTYLSWRKSGERLFIAWMVLNLFFVVSGLFTFTVAILRRI